MSGVVTQGERTREEEEVKGEERRRWMKMFSGGPGWAWASKGRWEGVTE